MGIDGQPEFERGYCCRSMNVVAANGIQALELSVRSLSVIFADAMDSGFLNT
jgi:hypothetical protein